MFEFLYNFYGANQEIFVYINKITNYPPILPYILKSISYCFNIGNFAICYCLFLVYFWLQLHTIQDFNKLSSKFWPIYHKLVLIGIIYTIFCVTYATLKYSINLPRPFCSLPTQYFITIVKVKLERCLSSFPSSHAGLALLTAYIIWPHTTLFQKIFLYLMVLVVALSRITLAMHYPADIIYSFVITTIIIVISKVIFKIFVNNLINRIGNILVKKF